MRNLAALLVLMSLLSACATLPPPLSWKELDARALPLPGLRIAYGEAAPQFGELRLPAGRGPFPVVVLIHGGCWLQQFDYRHATRVADALLPLGVAVWTLEYRRLGDAGGGWPNTLLDVAQATDHLRVLAQTYPLDLERVIAMGHSAGGQLALWLAARPQLPPDSALYRPDPLPLRGVLGLAPITDLVRYRIGPAGSCHSAVEPLLGGTPEEHPARYAQASPLALLPLRVPQQLVQGARDPIVSADSVADYARAAEAQGDTVQLHRVDAAGHFELVAPGSVAWPTIARALQALLAP
jgi:acetyl esterase/lipase